MANLKVIGIAAIISAILGGLVTYKLLPAKEITKVEIQEKEVIKKDIITVTKEITKPDGTKEIVTTTTDKSVEKKDKQIESLVQKVPQKQWLVSAGVARESLVSDNIYQLTVQKRIIGPVFAGVSATTQKAIGLTVTMEF